MIRQLAAGISWIEDFSSFVSLVDCSYNYSDPFFGSGHLCHLPLIRNYRLPHEDISLVSMGLLWFCCGDILLFITDAPD